MDSFICVIIEFFLRRNLRKKFSSDRAKADFDRYHKEGFPLSKLKQLAMGAENNIDYTQYADKTLSVLQMQEISLGLEHGVDVSLYKDRIKYDSDQMNAIRIGLEKGVDVSKYFNPRNDKYVMREILEKLLKEN